MTTTTLKLPLQHRTDSSARNLPQILALFSLWYNRAHQRHQLSELSQEQLKDIGVTRAIANAEAMKPFWQR